MYFSWLFLLDLNFGYWATCTRNFSKDSIHTEAPEGLFPNWAVLEYSKQISYLLGRALAEVA